MKRKWSISIHLVLSYIDHRRNSISISLTMSIKKVYNSLLHAFLLKKHLKKSVKQVYLWSLHLFTLNIYLPSVHTLESHQFSSITIHAHKEKRKIFSH